MKKKILFNGISLGRKKITGVERFALGQLYSLARKKGFEIYVLHKKNITIEKISGVKYIALPFYGHITFYLFGKIIKKYLKAHHVISPHSFPMWQADSSDVFTIHDVAWFYYPEFFPFIKLKILQILHYLLIKSKASIHCVSQNTKNDVEKFYKRKVNIFYAYPGANYKIVNENNNENNNNEKYILFIGTFQKRKNLQYIFDEIENKNLEIDLKIIGGFGWKSEYVIKHYESMSQKNKIEFIGYVSEERKQQLIKNCVAIVFPSLYEGFGFPILEGLKYGKVTIAANNSSLSEITYDKKLLIDISKQGEIKKAINYINDNDQKIRQHIKIMKENFTWEKFSEEYTDYLNKISN